VAEAAIEAFRTLPNLPIYSPRRAEFVPVNPRHDGSAIDVIAWSEWILGRASDERRALLVWARAMARRRIRRDRHLRLVRSVPGGSVSDHCREAGVCRRTFDRRRVRACERIAVELSRIGREEIEVDLRDVIGADHDWRTTVATAAMPEAIGASREPRSTKFTETT
jgi:hypothetical protein